MNNWLIALNLFLGNKRINTDQHNEESKKWIATALEILLQRYITDFFFFWRIHLFSWYLQPVRNTLQNVCLRPKEFIGLFCSAVAWVTRWILGLLHRHIHYQIKYKLISFSFTVVLFFLPLYNPHHKNFISVSLLFLTAQVEFSAQKALTLSHSSISVYHIKGEHKRRQLRAAVFALPCCLLYWRRPVWIW